MARRRLIAVCAVAAIACGAGAVVEQNKATTAENLQAALVELNRGNLDMAHSKALALASRRDHPVSRAWLIVAAARQRQKRYNPAIKAYESFLATCTSADLRRYATGQIRRCRVSLKSASPPITPSAGLMEEDISELSHVDKETFTESTEHFVVRARNARVAKLIAVTAENSLQRICGDILAGQDYPHSVEIYVWPVHDEYCKHAEDAPEWAGGSFSMASTDGVVSRKIDLTQLDENGRFAVIMLDRILPHEMCHLVLAEYFGDTTCPLALNEGLAMLAETATNNARVELAGVVLAAREPPSLDDLFSRGRHNMGDPRVFYSKAYSIVEFLRRRMSGSQFSRFLNHVKDNCSVGEAIGRALYVPADGNFLKTLERAWKDRAVRQSQFLRALREDDKKPAEITQTLNTLKSSKTTGAADETSETSKASGISETPEVSGEISQACAF